jgi:hypothetical protein
MFRGRMTGTLTISTKLHQTASKAASKYKAHVLLTENREITKEEAVNELIELGARGVLPPEVVKSLNLDKRIKK